MLQQSNGASGQYLRLETPGTPRLMQRGGDGERTRCTRCAHTRLRCGALMRRIVSCLCGDGRPALPESRRGGAHDRVAQYQAPEVATPPRASSSSSLGECDHEQGTLLPKRATPEPGPSSSSAAAAAGTAQGSMLQELPKHRRTGSGASLGRPRTAPEASPALAQQARGGAGSSGAGASSSSSGKAGGGMGSSGAGSGAKLAKGGLVGGGLSSDDLEGGGVGTAMLLGGSEQDDEDEDVCPTCLEGYTSINPRIYTQCGHSFHVQCLYAWLERKATCPLCESQIQFDEAF